MKSLFIKPLMLICGTSAAGCSTVFLEYNTSSEPTFKVKTNTTKIPERINSYADILPFQKSKGCHFWLVKNWGNKEVVGPNKMEELLTKERPNENKTGLSTKETKFLEKLNEISEEHCKDGKHITIHYKNGNTWDIHDGT